MSKIKDEEAGKISLQLEELQISFDKAVKEIKDKLTKLQAEQNVLIDRLAICAIDFGDERRNLYKKLDTLYGRT